MKNTINPELLRVREVASLLGIGISTVWLKLRQGLLPKPVKLGCSVRWRRSDLDAWLAKLTA
jgi:excisionase family DNA binding protein